MNGMQKDNIRSLLSKNKRTFHTEYSNMGSAPINVSVDDFKKHAEKASSRHVEGINEYENNIELLHDIVKLSTIEKFDIFLVTPPATKQYRELIPDEVTKTLKSTLLKIQKKGAHIYLLNHYDSGMYSESHFKDSDHLNTEGAKLFTHFINKLIDQTYSK